MIVSAAELFTIIILSARFISRLCCTPSKNYLLILISILLISTPSTAFAFIQLIYSKRILILLFSIYILFYLRYQPSKVMSERNITPQQLWSEYSSKMLAFYCLSLLQLFNSILAHLDSFSSTQNCNDCSEMG